MFESTTDSLALEVRTDARPPDLALPAALLDHNPHPVLCFDAGGRLRYANPAARRIRQAFRGSSPTALWQALSDAAEWLRTQPANQPAVLEANGQCWQVSSASAADQELTFFYLVDVTAWRATEQQLRHQQDFRQLMLDTSSTLFTVYDTADRPVFYNRAVRELMQHLQVYSGPAHHDPATPAYAERRRRTEINEQVRQTNGEVREEMTLTLDSGERRWYQTVRCPLHNPDGTVFVLGVTTDITDLKRHEQVLALREKQYHDLLRHTQTLICTHDLTGRLLTVNPALAALLQRPEAELVGQPLGRFLQPEQQGALSRYLARVGSAGSATGVLRVGTAPEKVRYLLFHNTLVQEPDQPAYVIGHSHDITARIEAEREARRSRQQAAASARAREVFLASISHEVRTPIHGMLGLAAQLGKTALTERQRYLLSSICQAGAHLTGLLNDVLDLSRLNSGAIELEAVPFVLGDSVDAVLRPLAAQAREKGLRFQGATAGRPFPRRWVLGDPLRLNQILLNLVSNAVKFTDRGSIRVSCRVLAESSTALRVRFRVADTGIGIAPEMLASVFDDFTQAHAATGRHYGGAGLGLSISRRLARQMGGTLGVTSQPGRGSCFTLELALPKAPAGARPAPAAEQPSLPARLAGLRVLLADDNEMNREVTRLTLADWGIRPTEAASGAEALRLLAAQDFDVALLDIQMPDLSGLEVVRRLRALPHPARAHTPVIAFTAATLPRPDDYYRRQGIIGRLAKPFSEAELCQQLLAVPRPARPYSLAGLQSFAKGDHALVDKVVASFLNNAPAALAKLSAAAAEGDWRTAAQQVHYLHFNLKTLDVGGLESCTTTLLAPIHGRGRGPAAVDPAVFRAAAQEFVATVEDVVQALRRDADAHVTGSE
ncbi:PAS domain-containing hybrid sensor histidine kinase/response regulator [Hymenobacter armeniacus]|uniref:histidine kinase n=1 Tax=Hymenobacter armeniacus TaxID=2771358 RepID=A0ABR8JTD7_9BACT|nr:PAS domain-containing hybrid sensor histidine kinase/response regulator [Hymenobacter armeniacus]MBD2722188.1 PAS domain-containing protein [Hymenobacter armeniacus]